MTLQVRQNRVQYRPVFDPMARCRECGKTADEEIHTIRPESTDRHFYVTDAPTRYERLDPQHY